MVNASVVNFDMREHVTSVVLNFLDTPRFGRSSNITALFDADSVSSVEYKRGLIIAGVLTATIYIFWLILLIIFYCLGRDRVGFLSGEPFHREIPLEAVKRGSLRMPRTPRTYTSSQDSTATESVAGADLPAYFEAMSLKNRPTWVRILFVATGLLFIVAAILLFVKGVASLHRDVVSIHETSQELYELVHDAWQVFDTSLNDIGTQTNETFQSFRREKAKRLFCPNGDINKQDDSIGLRMYEQVMESLRQLQPLKDFLGDDGHGIERTLKNLLAVTRETTITIEHMALVDWRVLLVVVPYTLIPFLLMIGASMALFRSTTSRYILSQDYFIGPLFILAVTVAWGVAAATVIVAGANKDFCLPGDDPGASPDDSALGLLAANGVDANVLNAARWYASQCTVDDDPFKFLRAVVPKLSDGASQLSSLAMVFEQSDISQALATYCGRNFDNMHRNIVRLNELVALLAASATQTLEVLSCDTVVPMYIDAVYGDMCSNTPSDLFWIFCCCIILGILGMVMITMRVSWQDTIYNPPSQAPVLSLDDSIGQILADDELSHATSSECSEPMSRQAKIEALTAVANIDFVKNQEASRVDNDALELPFGSRVSRKLDPDFFAASGKCSSANRTLSTEASLTLTTVSPASSDHLMDSAVDHAESNEWDRRLSDAERMCTIYPNRQPDSFASQSDKFAPDPPLIDVDGMYTDSDIGDDQLRICHPSLVQGNHVAANFDEIGQEFVLSKDVHSVDESFTIDPPMLLSGHNSFRASSTDETDGLPLGPPLHLSIENDFFFADDADRQLWRSS